jgi:hypothetical protein
MQYRFPRYKDASWNSYDRQRERYTVIRQLLGQNTVGAEIGVYKGGFAEFLLPHCRRLYLVDPWYRLKPFWGERKPENSSVIALINILQVYSSEIEESRVVVIPDFSVNFLNGVKQREFDWIYLDASHSYKNTASEIEASVRVIRPGGYLMGDDYDPDPASNQHGVYLAVNEFIQARGIQLAVNSSRQWAFQVSA